MDMMNLEKESQVSDIMDNEITESDYKGQFSDFIDYDVFFVYDEEFEKEFGILFEKEFQEDFEGNFEEECSDYFNNNTEESVGYYNYALLQGKMEFLKERILSLSFDKKYMAQAVVVIKKRFPHLVDSIGVFKREWMNDLVNSYETSDYEEALLNPGKHFVDWCKVRMQKPYHVSYRAVDQVSLIYGEDLALQLVTVFWPQEIAWAQRNRLSHDPSIASKSAMFLREVEGDCSGVFLRFCDVYTDQLLKVDHYLNENRELTADEIRFGTNLPDYDPVYLIYASRKYFHILSSLPQKSLLILANKAKSDEETERKIIFFEELAQQLINHPMRYMPMMINHAQLHGLTSNELYVLENGFINLVKDGLLDVSDGVSATHMLFSQYLEDEQKIKKLLKASDHSNGLEYNINNKAWEISQFNEKWVKLLPDVYSRWNQNDMLSELIKWQVTIMQKDRPVPYDPISDFGFWMISMQDK